jgi:hypothetical protein
VRDAGLFDAVPITEIPLGGKIQAAPFELEMIVMTHSIPEPNALAIRTKFGTVFHTGDWKIDPEPLLGEVTDEATLQRIGEQGALAMVCDSTNVFVEGRGGLGGDDPRQPRESWSRPALAGCGDLLRLQPGAGREHRQGGGRGGRHPVLSGRALAAHGRGGAGMRLTCSISPTVSRAAGGLPAARQGAASSAPAARASARARWPSWRRRASRPVLEGGRHARSSPRA